MDFVCINSLSFTTWENSVLNLPLQPVTADTKHGAAPYALGKKQEI